jgi:hypothetical protein
MSHCEESDSQGSFFGIVRQRTTGQGGATAEAGRAAESLNRCSVLYLVIRQGISLSSNNRYHILYLGLYLSQQTRYSRVG